MRHIAIFLMIFASCAQLSSDAAVKRTKMAEAWFVAHGGGLLSCMHPKNDIHDSSCYGWYPDNGSVAKVTLFCDNQDCIDHITGCRATP